jgi:hypothetical protein
MLSLLLPSEKCLQAMWHLLLLHGALLGVARHACLRCFSGTAGSDFSGVIVEGPDAGTAVFGLATGEDPRQGCKATS